MKKCIFLVIILYILIFSLGCKVSIKLGNITGIVTLDGTPSADITVSVSGTSVTTNSNGIYTISGIMEGSILITASKSGYKSQSTTFTVTGGSTTVVSTITINLSSEPGSISGTVRLYEQIDYSGITVEIIERNLYSNTDTLGNYSFSNLEEGNVTLRFIKSGYNNATANATISKGENTTVSVINLTPSTGSITGYAVYNDDQSNHTGITVAVSGNQQLSVTTASDGSFSITTVPTGTYTLIISKTGYATRTLSDVNVQNAQTTNAGITAIYREYDMSYLSGDIKSMTQINGFLYIATSQYLYKISQSNPTTAVIQQAVTHNYDSMMAGPFAFFGPTQNLIFAFCKEGTAIVQVPIYTESLGDALLWNNDGDIIPPAVTCYNSNYFFRYDSTNGSKFIKCDINNGNGVASPNINEIGILSLEYVGGHFYACNSTAFYKYDTLTTDYPVPYSVTVAPLGGGSDLIGITCDGSYIWLIDRTTNKLMKIKDDSG